MANHLQPTITSTYANFVSEMDARFDDLAVGLDPAATTATNVPVNSIRFTSAGNKWQKYNGSAWNDLAATYAIAISGNAATVTNGVYTTATYANPAFITSLAGSKITGDIGGTAATATKLFAARNINGVAFDGSAAISVDLNNSVTFNNAGSGAASGAAFTGGTAVTVSYNTVGAPSITGTDATGTWGISISGSSGSTTGNAASVTNGVYTTGDQTIGGTKTFSSIIAGSISGNAGTATTATTATSAGSVTNGVYTTGDQTIGGTKTFSSTSTGSISGSAGSLYMVTTAGDAYFTPAGGSAVANAVNIYYKLSGRIITAGNGSVRIKAVVGPAASQDPYGGAGPAFYRIYKNAVAVTGDIGVTGAVVTWIGDFTCAAGDTFELYGRSFYASFMPGGQIYPGFSTYTYIAPSVAYST
jgi:hypothetical protein